LATPLDNMKIPNDFDVFVNGKTELPSQDPLDFSELSGDYGTVLE